MVNRFPKNSYVVLSRDEWSLHAANIHFDFSEAEVTPLLGFAEKISNQGINDFYAPLVAFIEKKLVEHQDNHKTKIPFILGITGSVSVGKSTFTRILKLVLETHFRDKKIDYVNTDGFIYPLSYLEEHNLLGKKGFPESYDSANLIKFITDVKANNIGKAPIYSHLTYDIIPGEFAEIYQPDILIVEGLNVLPSDEILDQGLPTIAQDLDLSIYIDAETPVLKDWYIKRFLDFKQKAFADKNSYFYRYSQLSDEEARAKASKIWQGINEVNLNLHILPARERADIIIQKDQNHKLALVKIKQEFSKSLA